MLKNANLIAYDVLRAHVSTVRLKPGHGFPNSISASRHQSNEAAQHGRDDPTSSQDVGGDFEESNGGLIRRVALNSACAIASRFSTVTVPIRDTSTSVASPSIRLLRQTRASFHTEAHAHSQRTHSDKQGILGGEEDAQPASASNSDSRSSFLHTSSMEANEDDERWELEIMKEEMYEEMLDDLRVAMKYNDAMQTRSRSMAWTDGYTGEKSKEKLERVRNSMKAKEKEKRRDMGVEGRRRERDTDQRTRISNDSQPRTQGTSLNDPANPLLKHILPIYHRNEHLRFARIRKDDPRNLSYLDAEAKLGISSELYFGSSFVSGGRKRGGRGKETDRWRAKTIVDRFERETSERVTWIEERERFKGKGNGKGKRGVRRKRTGSRDQGGGKDSFVDVWGDLTTKFQS